MSTRPRKHELNTASDDVAPVGSSESEAVLHRIREVRLQQGVSVRCAARRMSVDIGTVRKEEESPDLPLTSLYRWQRALQVPIAELLVDDEGALSVPVLKRARMVKLMKTARSILERTESAPQNRLAQRLVDQLLELMPELGEVSSWHTVGQRRTRDEMGRAAENPVSDRFILDAGEFRVFEAWSPD